jgi:hypothetical protein
VKPRELLQFAFVGGLIVTAFVFVVYAQTPTPFPNARLVTDSNFALMVATGTPGTVGQTPQSMANTRVVTDSSNNLMVTLGGTSAILPATIQLGTSRSKLASSADGLQSVTNAAANSGLEDSFGADVTVNTCGTGAPTAGSKNSAGEITATGATACTVVFSAPTFTNSPFCVATPESGTLGTVTVTGTASFTITGIAAGAKFFYLCRGRI